MVRREVLLRLMLCLGMAGCQYGLGSPAQTSYGPLVPALDVNHDPPVPPAPQPRGRLQLIPVGGFLHGEVFGSLAAEIAAYDAGSRRLFVVNGEKKSIDILDISNPAAPVLATRADISDLGAANSVAAKHGMIAVCVAAESKREPGKVVFLSPDGERLNIVEVGYEPDMLTFSPDGRWLLVANEAEPTDDYDFDPDGSVSQIDLSAGVEKLSQSDVTALEFGRFNDVRESLDPSIRIIGQGTSVAQDLEPEYIAVAADSKTAWITCQENNAIAIADLEGKVITRLVGLGFKDHSLDGNWLDAGDTDKGIRIRPWPLMGMYQPDAIAAFTAAGETFLVTANEGEARAYKGFRDECQFAELTLDPTVFPNAAELQKGGNLGRLRVTNTLGDRNGDGAFEELYCYGTRSFSIWNRNGEQVFDSGDQFERILAEQCPDSFNSDHESHCVDDRSDNKGPEPEGVVLGEIDAATYAFVLLERASGLMVYDVSDPTAPVFECYWNGRDLSAPARLGSGGDLGPEGGIFIPAEFSPTGKPLLAVCYEVSGTTRIYEVSISGPDARVTGE